MKDLAYLNAGAARVNNGGTVAGDVDADHSGEINLADLAILDEDWGKSLHADAQTYQVLGDRNFQGSSDQFTMDDLEQQGNHTWDNEVFKAQNALENQHDFVGSLESPTSNVIGADGNTNAWDDLPNNGHDMLDDHFQ